MPNCKTVIPYQGTPEQEERLRKVIEEHKGQPGATMPVLQAAQEIFGYLPEEVQIMVAEGLDIPLSEVYGVATFYAQFSLSPKGKYNISICLGTACYVKGADKVLTARESRTGNTYYCIGNLNVDQTGTAVKSTLRNILHRSWNRNITQIGTT